MLDKKSLSEKDICTKFVTPAIVKAGIRNADQLLQTALKEALEPKRFPTLKSYEIKI